MATATSRLQIIIDVLTGKSKQEVSGLEASLGKFVSTAAIAAAAVVAMKKAFDFAKDATLLAARVDTLGAVTQLMGRTAGLSAVEIHELEKGIQSMGITTQASRQSLAQMVRAEIDLSKATDLARLAQDAAVISGDNSSQAFEKLTLIIGTGNTLMARRMGLLVDFEGAYKTLAATLGKSADELTQVEKVQARTNEVMAQGATIAGAYSAAMETTGKKLSSFARHTEELKLAFGSQLEEGLGMFVDISADTIDVITARIKVQNILKESVDKGTITQREANEITREAFLTNKTFAEVLEELGVIEKENVAIRYDSIEAIERAKEVGVEYEDLMWDIADGVITVGEAVLILNERLEEQGQLIKTTSGDVRDYSKNVFDAGEALTRYGAAQEKFNARAQDGARQLRINQKEQENLNATLATAKNRLDGVSTGIRNTIDAYKEQIEFVSAGGQNLVDQADKIIEAYGEGLIDGDTATEALNLIKEGAIDLDLELGKIDTVEAVQEFVKMGFPIDVAREKVAVLQASLFAMTGRDYQINVIIKESGGGGGGGGDGGGGGGSGGGGGVFGGGVVFPLAKGTDGWQTVPPGYPNDSYRVGLTSGEEINVKPKGGSGEGMTNIFHITGGGDPQAIAQEVIQELQFRMN